APSFNTRDHAGRLRGGTSTRCAGPDTASGGPSTSACSRPSRAMRLCFASFTTMPCGAATATSAPSSWPTVLITSGACRRSTSQGGIVHRLVLHRREALGGWGLLAQRGQQKRRPSFGLRALGLV